MNNKVPLFPLGLSLSAKGDAALEHRRVFSSKYCEVNILETYRHCMGLPLHYDGLVVSAMMRGKKIMHLDTQKAFQFLPGETVILPEESTFTVDFPEAGIDSPVQCATLTIERAQINETLAFLNEQYPKENSEWKLDFNRYHFYNNQDLAQSLNRLIQVSMEDKRDKDVLTDLALKSLLVEIIHTQQLPVSAENYHGSNRFSDVLEYIHANLIQKINIAALCKKACMSKSVFFRSFKMEFGLSPLDYIIHQRIQLAKKLLEDPAINISTVCYQCGFNNVGYFARMFRKIEGVNAGAYRRTV